MFLVSYCRTPPQATILLLPTPICQHNIILLLLLLPTTHNHNHTLIQLLSIHHPLTLLILHNILLHIHHHPHPIHTHLHLHHHHTLLDHTPIHHLHTLLHLQLILQTLRVTYSSFSPNHFNFIFLLFSFLITNKSYLFSGIYPPPPYWLILIQIQIQIQIQTTFSSLHQGRNHRLFVDTCFVQSFLPTFSVSYISTLESYHFSYFLFYKHDLTSIQTKLLVAPYQLFIAYRTHYSICFQWMLFI